MNIRNPLAEVVIAILFAVCGCADRAKDAFEKGVSAYQKGDYDKAIADLPRPSDSIRNMPGRITTGALPTWIKGDLDKAIADYDEAIRLDPKFARRITTGATPRRQGRIRQGDCRLQRGHPAGPEGRRSVLQPRPCLPAQGRLRQSDCRLYRSYPTGPAGPEAGPGVLQPGCRLHHQGRF